MSDVPFPDIPLDFGVFDWVEWGDAPLNEVFENKLKIIEFAEEAGFYCYHVAEHHGTPLSVNGNPSLFLAAAAQRTSRIRLSPLTYCLPWHNPFRLYNEICMLDQLSQGRLDLGVSRGVSPIEANIYGVQNIEESRALSQEVLDILLVAFNSTILNFAGKRYTYENVELWNRPYQQPYPPLWFPSSNADSVPFIAKHGFNTSHNFAPNEVAKPHFDHYKQEWSQHANDPDRMNAHVATPRLTNSRHIYVAPTDKEALEEVREPFGVWREHITHLGQRVNAAENSVGDDEMTKRINQGTLIVGSPETVADKVNKMIDDTGINYFLGVFSYGNMPNDKAIRSMNLFAREVIPAVKQDQIAKL